MSDSEPTALGTAAPPFRLSDPDGREVSLEELHRDAAALVVFIRGWW